MNKISKNSKNTKYILITHELFAHQCKVKGPTYIKMLEYCECLCLVYLY